MRGYVVLHRHQVKILVSVDAIHVVEAEETGTTKLTLRNTEEGPKIINEVDETTEEVIAAMEAAGGPRWAPPPYDEEKRFAERLRSFYDGYDPRSTYDSLVLNKFIAAFAVSHLEESFDEKWERFHGR